MARAQALPVQAPLSGRIDVACCLSASGSLRGDSTGDMAGVMLSVDTRQQVTDKVPVTPHSR